MDLSIITPSCRPTALANYLTYLKQQSLEGVDYEVIIIQESNTTFAEYNFLSYTPHHHILRQGLNHDYGATARDRALLVATGKYVIFWDDDNIYYPHALATMVSLSTGADLGIARVRHQDRLIPNEQAIKPGEIDSMCFVVRRELAVKVKWKDDGGRFSDYRWISKVARFATTINYTKIVIGEHL